MSIYVGLYSFLVAYAIVMLIYVINVMKKSINYSFLLLLCCNIVNCLGYLWGMTSQNVNEGLVSMKITYFGGVPMLYFLFKTILSVCKLKIPKWLNKTMSFLILLNLYDAMMIGVNHSFYKSAELVKTAGYSYLVRSYGPLHTFYVITLILYMFASLIASLYALFRPTLVSRVMASILALTETIAISVYFLEKVLGLHIELLPFANMIMLTMDLFIIRKLYMYDADRVSQEENEQHGDTGVLLFDNYRRYLGSNLVAKNVFEEINEYYVEQRIPPKFEGKKLFEGLIENYSPDGESYNESEIFEKNDQIYKVRVGRLYMNNRKNSTGYIVEIINDTQTQSYIREINKINSDLDEAAKAANAASEAKSNFLANMSHEIRTPINAVIGMNSIILRDTKEESTREYAKDVDSAGKSLLALINDILDFSKVEAGKMTIVPVEYHLSSLLNDCQSMLYNKVKDKGLEFTLNCNEKAPSVLYGDEIRLRQIIINILTNAVKYTEKGSVTLNADYEYDGYKNINLIVSVKDTGMGISEENQKHLFESFKRVDEKKNRNIEGTGLGLALVKNLAELMNGDVVVKSKPNEGSTFTIKIPQRVISDTPVGKINSAGNNASVNKMEDLINTEDEILVVDDVLVNLKVFTHLLAKSKLKIETADCGQKALEKARSKKYDIIFLDHMMPGMDGIETFHKIREDADGVNSETPVVMLTANAIEGIKEQYINEGFDDYLSKPVNYNPLKDMIIKYIN